MNTCRASQSTVTAVLLAVLLVLPAGVSANATIGISLVSAPVEGSVQFAATGELDSSGALEAFVASASTQACPATMQEATVAFLGKPVSEYGGPFNEGFEVWVVQPGPILACAYSESFHDNTEAHAALSVTITPAPDTTCDVQTRMCTRVTTTTTPSKIIREECKGVGAFDSCHTETQMRQVGSKAPKPAVHRKSTYRCPSFSDAHGPIENLRVTITASNRRALAKHWHLPRRTIPCKLGYYAAVDFIEPTGIVLSFTMPTIGRYRCSLSYGEWPVESSLQENVICTHAGRYSNRVSFSTERARRD